MLFDLVRVCCLQLCYSFLTSVCCGIIIFRVIWGVFPSLAIQCSVLAFLACSTIESTFFVALSDLVPCSLPGCSWWSSTQSGSSVCFLEDEKAPGLFEEVIFGTRPLCVRGTATITFRPSIVVRAGLGGNGLLRFLHVVGIRDPPHVVRCVSTSS